MVFLCIEVTHYIVIWCSKMAERAERAEPAERAERAERGRTGRAGGAGQSGRTWILCKYKWVGCYPFLDLPMGPIIIQFRSECIWFNNLKKFSEVVG